MSPDERLREILDRFFIDKPATILGRSFFPLDISKPNLHDTKSEFIAEKSMVDESIQSIEQLVELLYSSLSEEEGDHTQAAALTDFLNLRAGKKHKSTQIKSPSDLVRKNASEIGLSHSLSLLLLDFQEGLRARKQELKDQEVEFWSGSSRPPNHYARTIALRFARLIAKKSGKRPTFGTSRDGSHPSTDFGRALEEIFEILGITAKVKSPASWAIDQLTDEDYEPEPVNHLATYMTRQLDPTKNALRIFDTAIQKK